MLKILAIGLRKALGVTCKIQIIYVQMFSENCCCALKLSLIHYKSLRSRWKLKELLQITSLST